METEDKKARRERFVSTSRSGRVLAGMVLMIVGGVLLSREFGADIPDWIFNWEMILISLGIFFGARRNFQPGGWIVMILVGSAFLINHIYPEISLTHFIWPVVIILVGFWMIMRPRRNRHEWKEWKWESSVSDENAINTNSVFSGTKKKVMSKEFKGGEINSVFGGNDLDLSQADIIGTASIEVNVVFGGVKLIVPPHWKVVSEVDCVFGSVEDKRRTTTEVSDKTLILKGSVAFGGIEIKSY